MTTTALPEFYLENRRQKKDLRGKSPVDHGTYETTRTPWAYSDEQQKITDKIKAISQRQSQGELTLEAARETPNYEVLFEKPEKLSGFLASMQLLVPEEGTQIISTDKKALKEEKSKAEKIAKAFARDAVWGLGFGKVTTVALWLFSWIPAVGMALVEKVNEVAAPLLKKLDEQVQKLNEQERRRKFGQPVLPSVLNPKKQELPSFLKAQEQLKLSAEMRSIYRGPVAYQAYMATEEEFETASQIGNPLPVEQFAEKFQERLEQMLIQASQKELAKEEEAFFHEEEEEMFPEKHQPFPQRSVTGKLSERVLHYDSRGVDFDETFLEDGYQQFLQKSESGTNAESVLREDGEVPEKQPGVISQKFASLRRKVAIEE